MANNKDERRHFLLGSTGKAEKYTYPRTVIAQSNIPRRNRESHARSLIAQLDHVKSRKPALKAEAEDYELESSLGLQVTFDSFPGVDLTFESLADSRQKIELLNVRHHGDQVTATVFVPIDKIGFFEKKVQDYLGEKKNKKGGPMDHRKLIDAIKSIRESAFIELWNDDDSVLPQKDEEEIWWEIWLPVLNDRSAVLHDFKKIAGPMEIEVSRETLNKSRNQR